MMQKWQKKPELDNLEVWVRHFFKKPMAVPVIDRNGDKVISVRKFTVAAVIDRETGIAAVATAVVAERDQAVKAVGRAISVGRAKKIMALKDTSPTGTSYNTFSTIVDLNEKDDPHTLTRQLSPVDGFIHELLAYHQKERANG